MPRFARYARSTGTTGCPPTAAHLGAAVRLVAALAVASVGVLGLLATSARPAGATTSAIVPWNVDYYDFGSSPGSHVFTFTNITTLPIVDLPVPFQNESLLITRDTCTKTVMPGGTCRVGVQYLGSQGPVADKLALQFADPSGQPVPTPPVLLFANGAGYVATGHRNGVFTTTTSAAGGTRHEVAGRMSPAVSLLVLHYVFHNTNPVDFPPELGGPWSVVANQCLQPKPGATSCNVTVQFAPSAPGTYVSDFQMQFENPASGASVPTQDLTLEGSA